MRLTPRVAGFRSEYPAGFKLECMAGFVGTRKLRGRAVSPRQLNRMGHHTLRENQTPRTVNQSSSARGT